MLEHPKALWTNLEGSKDSRGVESNHEIVTLTEMDQWAISSAVTYGFQTMARCSTTAWKPACYNAQGTV